MPPKSTKSVVQKEKVAKKVVKKEESSDSESEQEEVQQVQIKPVKKTVSKKVVKKEESSDSESEKEQQEQVHTEVEIKQSEATQKETPWSTQISDNEQVEQEDTKEKFNVDNNVPEKSNQNNRFNRRNDKRFEFREEKNQQRNKTQSRFRQRIQHTSQNEQTQNEQTQNEQTEQLQNEEKEQLNQRPARYNMKTGNRVSTNKTSMALKFSYNDYENVANPVMEVSSEDLIKVLISRSYKDGQMTLKRSLECVLRAMNHECNFPMSN